MTGGDSRAASSPDHRSQFALAADQAERDHAALKAAVRKGEIVAVKGA
jgi:hypothetical protein